MDTLQQVAKQGTKGVVVKGTVERELLPGVMSSTLEKQHLCRGLFPIISANSTLAKKKKNENEMYKNIKKKHENLLTTFHIACVVINCDRSEAKHSINPVSCMIRTMQSLSGLGNLWNQDIFFPALISQNMGY